MLIGQHHTILSNKGRTAIPARFRKVLGSSIVIARWYERSLAIFSQSAWERIINLAVGDSLITRPARDTERFLLGGAYDVDLDDQGRFVIPGPLRDYAQLSEEIVFVGLGERVEVWGKEHWLRQEEEITSRAEELIEEVQKTKREKYG